MLGPNMPFLNDREGDAVPIEFQRVMDAHVHIFPDALFRAVRRWFDANAWHIRYALTSTEIIGFLLSRGIDHVVALQYAHAPGMSRELNRYMIDTCRSYPGRVTGMATVFPGEPEVDRILQDAFDAGLAGVKLHAHVQCFDLDAEETRHVFDVCQSNGKPIVAHVGKEPKSPEYRCDPDILCRADKLEAVLRDFPALRICVPHLGFSETPEYKALVEKYDTLWLDTTMVLTDYFPIEKRFHLGDYRIDRIMYGSDFPSIPYAWDRELKWLRDFSGLSEEALDRVLYKNAASFFGIPEADPV